MGSGERCREIACNVKFMDRAKLFRIVERVGGDGRKASIEPRSDCLCRVIWLNTVAIYMSKHVAC